MKIDGLLWEDRDRPEVLDDAFNEPGDTRPGVVIGRIGDTRIFGEVYGPFPREEARTVARRLTADRWREAQWSVYSVGELPDTEET